MTKSHLIFLSASQLAQMIRQRHISAVEALEAHLNHIALHNSTLNAIVTLDAEPARRRAAAADQALAQGELWGPLHGVPITLEDAHATAQVRSTWGGYPALAAHIPLEDGCVAARLKAAGSVLMGKTNGPTIWGDESIFGRTKNPWSAEHTPGGSSAGPAAALAAGLTPLDIGMDSLGSIEFPAHCCGILGMRPTQHRVPITGALFIDAVRKFRVMTVAGPMARTVEDLRLALQIIAGPDGLDAEVPPVRWQTVSHLAPSSLRVAWTPTFPTMPIAPEIRIAVEKLAVELERLGAHVEQCLPTVDYGELSLFARHLFNMIGEATEPPPEGSQPALLGDYLRALDRRDWVIAVWEQFFSEWDVFLCPAAPVTADPLSPGEWIVDGQVLQKDQLYRLDIPFALSPVTGCPAVVLPLGCAKDGLPFGVQLIGRRWHDERLLGIADAITEITGGFRRPPGF